MLDSASSADFWDYLDQLKETQILLAFHNDNEMRATLVHRLKENND